MTVGPSGRPRYRAELSGRDFMPGKKSGTAEVCAFVSLLGTGAFLFEAPGGGLKTDEVQYMVRKAVFDDIESIEDTYNEHFINEIERGAFTIFKKGIYIRPEKMPKKPSPQAHYMFMKKITILQEVSL